MNDITILFLTVNKVPKKWAAYQKSVLLKVIGDTPVITISKEPLDWGINLIQEGEINASNIYYQMLRGAKIAKTEYVAIVEDDSLYPKEHFFSFRPPKDKFAYNMTRWSLLTWGKPTYFYSNRVSNLTLLAPRELMIDALEERFAKYPNGTPEDRTGELGRKTVENRLKLSRYGMVKFYTSAPIINLNHIYSIDPLEIRKRKRMSKIRAFDIPFWGRADKIIQKFK